MKLQESIFKEISIKSDQTDDFAEKTTKLMIELNEALLSGDTTWIHKVQWDLETLKELQYIIEEDMELLKLYVSYSIASLTTTSMKKGLPKDEAEKIKRKFFLKIAHSRNKSELVQISIEVVNDLSKAIKQYSFQHKSLIIKMALEYIHSNKFKCISANDIALAINVNRSYLSKRFKIEVDSTITDYIHRIKMELAIELISTNVYHLNEISEMLGYTNYTYFSRVFKKYCLLSPNVYIKQN